MQKRLKEDSEHHWSNVDLLLKDISNPNSLLHSMPAGYPSENLGWEGIHQAVKDFHSSHFSADQMDLILHTKNSFEDMVATCQNFFSVIPNKHLHAVDHSKFEPAFTADHFGTRYTVYSPNQPEYNLRLKFILDDCV